MSRNHILYQGQESIGKPHLFGAQLSMEPFSGWSLESIGCCNMAAAAVCRIARDFCCGIFSSPAASRRIRETNKLPMSAASFFPGKTPFAVYFQYAGEDTSNGGSYLLGSASLTAGIDIPRLARYFDVTYEISEWQNIWYVHNIFLDGMSTIAWCSELGRDQRQFRRRVGARSQCCASGWDRRSAAIWRRRIRTCRTKTYYGGDLRVFSPRVGRLPTIVTTIFRPLFAPWKA